MPNTLTQRKEKDKEMRIKGMFLNFFKNNSEKVGVDIITVNDISKVENEQRHIGYNER